MAAEHNMTQVIMQTATEVAKAEIIVVKEADNPVRPIHTTPRSGGPAQDSQCLTGKQQTNIRYCLIFEIEVKNNL